MAHEDEDPKEMTDADKMGTASEERGRRLVANLYVIIKRIKKSLAKQDGKSPPPSAK